MADDGRDGEREGKPYGAREYRTIRRQYGTVPVQYRSCEARRIDDEYAIVLVPVHHQYERFPESTYRHSQTVRVLVMVY